jgi:hypothetical protein
MRKLVYSALALTLVSVPGFASDNEWSSLDQEIANLSSSLSAQNAPGPKLGGFIKTSFRYSTDQDALFGGPPNDQDESGFKIDKVRIEISGDANQDYSYKVSFDLASGVASLRDAYVQWKIADTFRATMGQFTKPVLSESLVSDKNLLFYQRTALGEFFRPRSTGLMLSGNFDTIEWSVAAQNGEGVDTGGDPDGTQTKQGDFNYSARLAANLMGAGAGKRIEGAYGAAQDSNLTVGIAWADNKSFDDQDLFGGDFAMTSGPFSLAGNVVSFGKGDPGGDPAFPAKDGTDLHWGSNNTNVSVDPADNVSFDLTVSYLFTPEYEAMLRYENGKAEQGALPEDPSVEAWSLGVNKYVQGHDIKWTLQVLHTDSDDTTNEIDEWTLGLTVGI